MNIVFIPVYIGFIGIESYGLISFYSLLYLWFNLLDFGLSPAASRLSARYTGGDGNATEIRSFIVSAEIVMLCMGLIIFLGTLASSSWLANSWIKSEKLLPDEVAYSICLMGVVIAFRVIEGLYKSSLNGLQRQVHLNMANALIATIRGVGAIFVLKYISPTITAFFWWQICISLASALLLRYMTFSAMPAPTKPARFSLKSLLENSQFSSGMMAISLVTLISSQADKVMLSKFLSLSDFGSYSLAFLIANSLFIFITPISQAFYPEFCRLHAKNDEKGIRTLFHKGVQLGAVLGSTISLIVIFQSSTLLMLWTGNKDLTDSTSSLLSVLMLAFFMNSFLELPHFIQLTYGYVKIALRTNIALCIFTIPMLYLMIPAYGVMGVAWALVVINCVQLFFIAPLMLRCLGPGIIRIWMLKDILFPALIASVLVAFLNLFAESIDSRYQKFLFLFCEFVLILLIVSFSIKSIRSEILNKMKTYLRLS